MAKELVIEIASDVICPWCYIGKRRLEKALSFLDGEVKPQIRRHGARRVPQGQVRLRGARAEPR